MSTIRKSVFLAALFGATASAALAENAGANPQEIVIDFEGFPESTIISDQYAALGVTFGIAGSNAKPIISTEGAPATAFGGYDGSFDTPFVSGVSGLTDPPGNSVIKSSDIVITFAKPASRVRLWVMDIDGGHGASWTDRCRVAGADSAGIVLDMMTLDANDPGTGDLAHTMFELLAPEGSSGFCNVIVDVSDNMGFAIDDLRFTLMAEDGGGDDGGGDDGGPGGGDGDGGPGDDPGDGDPPSGGGHHGTPGNTLRVRPVDQTSPLVLADHGRTFITTEPDGGETLASVPFEGGVFEVESDLLPCGVPVYWSIVGIGPRGNTVRFGSKLDPIIVRPFADLTLDGTVDTADLGVMIQAFLSNSPAGDLNNDGLVDTADLGLLIGVFGESCRD